MVEGEQLMARDSSVVIRGIAAVFHDPPWKPWAIRGDGISGSGSSGLERVKNAFNEINDSLLSKLKIIGCEENDIKQVLEDAINTPLPKEAIEEKKKEGKNSSVHELHSLYFIDILTRVLENRGLHNAAEILRQARRKITIKSIRGADILASSIDRQLLLASASRLLGGGTRSVAIARKFFNPFKPSEYQLPLKFPIKADRIAVFILGYACLISKILQRISEKEGDRAVSPSLLLNFMYSLLEPVWYVLTSEKNSDGSTELFVPVADTRVPTHTIFDHLNAVLTAVFWARRQGEYNGCVGLVDLASVQSWISETRRFRDLWSASWLASWFAWKSVEGFVEDYGPGVLLQPPARLHPFYAAWLVSKLSSEPSEKDLAGKVAELLGLGKTMWPVDPTVPSRVILALPEEACSKFEDRVYEAYENAWKSVLAPIIVETSEACGELRKKIEGLRIDNRQLINKILEKFDEACPLLDKRVRELALKLEPPLPLRLATISIREAWNRAMKLECDENGARVLLYPLIQLRLLPKEEKRVRINASGRRSGPAYAMLADELYGGRKGSARLCSVCGVGFVVVYGDILDSVLGVDEELFDENNNLIIKIRNEIKRELKKLDNRWVLNEILGERLCPYCLVKRMLARFIEKKDDFPEKLVGLKLSKDGKDGREEIRWGSVVLYTGRSQLARETIIKIAAEIARRSLGEYGLLIYITRGISVLADENLVEEVGKELGEAVKNVPEKELSMIIERAASLAIELVDRPGLLDEIKKRIDNLYGRNGGEPKEELAKLFLDKREFEEKLEKPVREASRRYRRRYAIVKLDGDNIGRGVLRGALGIPTKEYFDSILNLNVAEDSIRSEVINRIMMLTCKINSKIVKRDGGGESVEVTFPVSLSYHYTVSRALAALAQINRKIVRDHGGMIVYTGGDDVLAVLPLVSKGKKGDSIEFKSLKGLIEFRRAYWGMHKNSRFKGFIVLQSSNGYPISVTPALVAYGQSGALYYADSNTPFWTVLETASGLEESKDNLYRRPSVDAEAVAKDFAVIGSESSGPAAIPFTIEGVRVGEVLESIRSLAEYLVGKKFYRRVSSKAPVNVSVSLLDDVLREARLLYTLSKTNPTILKKFAEYLIDRNMQGSLKKGSEETLSKLCSLPGFHSKNPVKAGLWLCRLPEDLILDTIIEYLKPNVLASLKAWQAAASTLGWIPEKIENREGLVSTLFLQAMLAARILYSST